MAGWWKRSSLDRGAIMETNAIVVAIIGAAAAIIASVVTVAIPHFLRKGSERNPATTHGSDCAPYYDSPIELRGYGYWQDGGTDWKVEITGTISKTHLSLKWQEAWPDGTWRTDLEGVSKDGVAFEGVYSYPPRATLLRTFKLQKLSLAIGITLAGAWRNPDPRKAA
jgi:hypothetical protein